MPEAFARFFAACGTSTQAELDLRDLTPAYRLYNEHGSVADVRTSAENVADLFESFEPGSGPRVRG